MSNITHSSNNVDCDQNNDVRIETCTSNPLKIKFYLKNNDDTSNNTQYSAITIKSEPLTDGENVNDYLPNISSIKDEPFDSSYCDDLFDTQSQMYSISSYNESMSRNDNDASQDLYYESFNQENDLLDAQLSSHNIKTEPHDYNWNDSIIDDNLVINLLFLICSLQI